LEVKGKLDDFASETSGGDGVLIDVNVPLRWWERTEIRDLPFKIVYDADLQKLFAIELNKKWRAPS
jgi:hypothetical protein